MKICVTGGTGFIGRYVVNELLKIPDIEIIIPTRTPWAYDDSSNIKYIGFDLSKIDNDPITGYGDVYRLLGNPDVLIHLAWDGLDNYSSPIHAKNLIQSYDFIRSMVSQGLKSVNVIGTCFEYGKVNGKLSEKLITDPSNPYAIAKDSLRRLIESLDDDFDFKWLRLFYLYGSGQRENSLLPIIDSSVNTGKTELTISGGNKIRDYLPVEIVAEYIVKSSIQTDITGIVNICSGNKILLYEFVKNYIKEKKYSIDIKWNDSYYPDNGGDYFWGDNEKLKKILDLYK